MKTNKFINTISSLIITLFSVSYLGLNYFLSGESLYSVSSIIFKSTGILSYVLLIYSNKLSKYFLSLSFIFLILIISAIFTSNYNSFFAIMMHLVFIGIGLLIIESNLEHSIILANFIFYALFFVYHMQYGISYLVFHSLSRNYHSIFMIYASILYYICFIKKRETLPLYPAAITFLISLWSVGRGGIISSSFLLFSIFTSYLLSNIKNRRKRIYTLVNLSIIYGIFVLFIYYFTRVNVVQMIDRLLTRGLTDFAREDIMAEYVKLVFDDIRNLVLGVPKMQNYFFARFQFNLHNSFLNLHSYYGIFGVLFFIFLNVNAIRYYWEISTINVFILITVYMRIFTDNAAFYGLLDPVIIFLLFYPFSIKNIKSKNSIVKQL
ncbi:MAG: oligosaccharide repeat unit polymerase [Candidatus Muirbacterium halophilum]|nr:oligosaccharide repeat unit polymerase [Candidatus Muirbacterium halophilum]MCK9472028.1 oligosaccharide repeat unit polymerase [Bacilli bacterium]